MKQVPACEYNPFEAVQTNVLGAQNVVDAAIDAGVRQVVALSTDKAVNPVNLYGATKLCEEKIIVQGNAYAVAVARRGFAASATATSSARGVRSCRCSSEQAQRGPAHDHRRAHDAVLDHARPGGRPRALRARAHGRRRGLHPEDPVDARRRPRRRRWRPGVPVDIIGIRPGEKLHEVLLTADEAATPSTPATCTSCCPSTPGGTTNPRWVDGKPLADGFVYARDTNDVARRPTSSRALLPMIPYGRQSIDDDDIAAVVDVLRGDWLTQGPAVERFERAVADGHRRRARRRLLERHRRPPRRGRAPPGSGPATSSPRHRCRSSASANCARYVGADVALVDIDPATLTSTRRGVRRTSTRSSPCTTPAFPSTSRALAHRPRVVIEDAAHALGASHARRPGRATARTATCAASRSTR